MSARARDLEASLAAQAPLPALSALEESDLSSSEATGLESGSDLTSASSPDDSASSDPGSEGRTGSEDDELDGALADVINGAEGSPSSQPSAQDTAAPSARQLNGRKTSGSTRGPAEAEGRDVVQREQGGATAADETREDPATDSSEDERKPKNTIGEVPLVWYKDEDHIGYDRRGEKLQRKARQDRLDALLTKNDSATQWRTVYDEYNDEEITLSKEEIRLLQRIRRGQFPHVEVNPYEPEADWFTRDQEIHPLSSAPEPKRRFMPSKWEEKKIVKLVRALRKGWIKREKDVPKEPESYLMWADDGNVTGKSASGLQYLPATKPQLPGHAQSYNPPKEYLYTEEEKAAHEELDDEDKPDAIPALFTSLRKVPAYERFINERFERCLDLYLCPRKPRKRPFVKDAQTLLPKLPKPQDLQPFPTTLLLRYLGHEGPVQSISVDSTGQWLASGSDDGTVRIWEVATGRCVRTVDAGSPVKCVAWVPTDDISVVAAAVGNSLLMISPGFATEEVEARTARALTPPEVAPETPVCIWQAAEPAGALRLIHSFEVSHVCWHSKGNYFASVAPTGNTQAILVHQLTKKITQSPFRRSRGRVSRVSFHPTKPIFFVATLNHVYVYNLAKQELVKRLMAGSSSITSLAVHPSGDHVIVGKQDNRLLWFDLDLSTRPYRTLRYHEKPLEAVAFHRRHPLFASAAADATVHVFHGMVYQDYMTNPLIVPVKVLRGHSVVAHLGVTDCIFHPTQPWLFSAGADATISLFTN